MPATKSTSELNLVDYAKAAADALLARHPEVVFTSGRRNAEDQARAMSGNIKANRNYIRDTYAASRRSTKCGETFSASRQFASLTL